MPYATVIRNDEIANRLISARKHYELRHNRGILPLVRDVILQQCPEYLTCYDMVLNSASTHFFNIFLCKKEYFDAYSEWLFGIFQELESRINMEDYTGDQSRVFGFLGERLLGVWFLHSNLRILELPVEQRDVDPAIEKETKNNEIRSLLKNLFRDFLSIYQQGKDMDLMPVERVAEIKKDRIPVFVCWWQGLEEAPEIIRMCISSIRKNFPEKEYDIHLITFDNLDYYAQFPNWIYEKFESGAISLTHLSDILRFYLLYAYGGIWIDSSYLIARMIDPETFSNRAFYTIKGASFEESGEKIKWSGNFMKMEAGNRLARFVLNAFYLYWATQDAMIDYYLIDHVIHIAYEAFDDIREMLDQMQESQPQVFEMAKVLQRICGNDSRYDIL